MGIVIALSDTAIQQGRSRPVSEVCSVERTIQGWDWLACYPIAPRCFLIKTVNQ